MEVKGGEEREGGKGMGRDKRPLPYFEMAAVLVSILLNASNRNVVR